MTIGYKGTIDKKNEQDEFRKRNEDSKKGEYWRDFENTSTAGKGAYKIVEKIMKEDTSYRLESIMCPRHIANINVNIKNDTTRKNFGKNKFQDIKMLEKKLQREFDSDVLVGVKIVYGGNKFIMIRLDNTVDTRCHINLFYYKDGRTINKGAYNVMGHQNATEEWLKAVAQIKKAHQSGGLKQVLKKFNDFA